MGLLRLFSKPRNDGILEFLSTEILISSWGMTKKVKLRDDREFRIPKKFRIPRDCFASLAMTQRILEFPKLEFPKLEFLQSRIP